MIGTQILQPQLLLLQEDHFKQNPELSLRSKEQECVSLLKKCKGLEDLKQVHAQIIKIGLFADSFCASNLVSTCALSDWGNMDYASLIFGQMDDPGSFEYNSMIRGYVKDKDFRAAICMFLDMLQNGTFPDNFTYPFVLKACAALCLLEFGIQIHGCVYKLGFHCDLFVQNSLVNIYGKCGRTRDSCAVFDEIDHKSVASWSALIAGHANSGMWRECVEIFGEMNRWGCWRAEESLLVSVLCACAHLGALDKGMCVHGHLLRNFKSLNEIVETSLMDMYIKCGSIEKGFCIFQRMRKKNHLSYCVMISGLAKLGRGHDAMAVFNEMLEEGIRPDDVAYLEVLSACRHAGLVEDGLKFFDQMKSDHGLTPRIEHYGCIVDLLCRAGLLEKAMNLINNMLMKPNDVIWRTVLSSARTHHNLEIAETALQNLVQLGSDNAGDHLIMSNIYAQAQMWDKAAMARTKTLSHGSNQVAGVSFVEAKRKVYSFASQDRSYHNWEEIHEMIHQMEWQLKFEGYVPDTSRISLNIDEEEKRERLRYHSQKLALAFALINTTEGTTIRIVRNVKMCSDCHTYTKFVSMIYSREIVVRDRNRFHHFKEGACSCGDYW